MQLRLLVALLTAVLLALSACGGSGDETPPIEEVDEDFVRYSASDVARYFKGLTGVDLEYDDYAAGAPRGTEELRLGLGSAGGSLPVSMRYGTFSIYVAKNEQALDALVRRAERRAVVGNVVLDAVAGGGDPQSRQAFQRTTRVLKTLGTPPEQVMLPPEDTPCGKAGIDPGGAGAEEGTCRFGQQTLTIANADGRLETPGKAISDVRVETGTTIVNDRFGGRQKFRAQGGFVAVTFRLENTGDEPIYARDPTLVVDGKRYSADPAKQTYLPVINPATIQPGAFETVAFLYDIPVPTARRGGRDGVIEVSGDEIETSSDLAIALGRIRLPSELPPPRGSIK
jgi:hypothetical protein